MICFGPFSLSSEALVLYRDGARVPLGTRAVQILLTLVRVPGVLVSKRELMDAVWPNLFVEDTNLRVHVSALRKALGDGAGASIVTVPGQGFRFVGTVDHEGDAEAATSPQRLASWSRSPLIGQDAFIDRAVRSIEAHRVLSLVGPGGIGKTAAAGVVVDAWSERHQQTAAFVDLAVVRDPKLIGTATAAALGLPGIFEDMTSAVVRAVGDREILLVLDNCEHLIEEAATFAAALVDRAPNLTLLATSREPLRIAGERVLRVPPLGFPESNASPNATDAARYAAVKLFVSAAQAIDGGFELNDGNSELVARLCRQLDGIPLAIEIAAAQVPSLGLTELLAGLNERLAVLSKGRRGTVPRHRTLLTTLEWSYDLLGQPHRNALQAFAFFAASFDLEDASAMLAGSEPGEGDALELISDLVEKSMLNVDTDGPAPTYRLLETTRSFLQLQAVEDEREDELRWRHARYMLLRATTLRDVRTREAVQLAGRYLRDIRLALDWALVGGSDVDLGVRLTAVSATFWMKLLSMREHHSYLMLAKAVMKRGEATGLTFGDEIALEHTVALSIYYRDGMGPEVEEALRRANELAGSIGDVAAQIKAVWLAYAFYGNDGAYRLEMECAERYRHLTSSVGDAFTRFVHQRMSGRAHHDLGLHAEGGRLTAGALKTTRGSTERLNKHDVEIDPWSAARGTLARTLWMQGFPDKARSMAMESVAEAMSIDHSASVCWTLVYNVCPILFWCGDVDAARSYIDLLLRQSSTILEHWFLWGGMYADALEAWQSGDVLLIDGGRLKTGRAQSDLFASLPAKLSRDFILDLEAQEENWVLPELLRRRADQLLSDYGADGEDAVEALLRRAAGVARRQGALGWELRIAISLSRLRLAQGRQQEICGVIDPVYKRFTEGFETMDLATARELMSTGRAAREALAMRLR